MGAIEEGFRGLVDHGLAVVGIVFFLTLMACSESGYQLGRSVSRRKPPRSEELSGTSTITAGMVGLLAFTLGLSISFAQSRFESRRQLVLSEGNAIGTAWLRAKLVGGAEGGAIAARIEDWTRVRLDYTTAPQDADIGAIIARGNVLQNEIWEHATALAQRAPTPVTASLVAALNEVFDMASAQRFAFVARLPLDVGLLLVVGSMLAMGALGYQFGLAGARETVLSALLLAMWTGALLLIVDLNRPRLGNIRTDPTPLIWAIEGFQTPPKAP